ncbi:hypothetical protein [Methylocella silvestris]|uniref:N-acetyltransferase domain-containing protein n=1 Tax=Methylocella silvestris TaxID=199596 RepID=A0A2J7TM99_METSI|nr:hypothetical protein [Methylocella silvestris]PNG27901.1 hypothetical protein CR492_03155 [Methylocella silvestris]
MREESRHCLVRVANKNDAEAIFFVLRECAGEVPVRMDGPDGETLIRQLIKEGYNSGHSYVAVYGDQVVGFLLAPHSNNGWFELNYGAILTPYRGMGLFSDMLNEIKPRVVGLYATVKDMNKSGMSARLLKAGFIETDDRESPDERTFRWVQAPLS